MALPVKRFWFLSNQIDRLRAEKDQRQIQLLASVTTKDGYAAVTEGLKEQVGQVYVWKPKILPSEIKLNPDGTDPEFDRAAFHALKAKIAAEKRK